ncbi:5-oxoprolinase subunit C family protein [Actinopolyspora erythraea]|uniref:5-oxoprolinase subunit C family protein n=1 Tax=Actinopolyspora erythraea TaxID=414996 RepID=UPI000A7A90A7|nr:biotin-dependent carboxyltransferase family protein [Actinopolyspora erythraea]
MTGQHPATSGTTPGGRAGRELEVLRPGPLSTVQDLGRTGLAAMGVGVSGAADRRSLRLANRLVGNAEEAAAVEVTLGGLWVRARTTLVVALTGASFPVTVDGRVAASHTVLTLGAGSELRVGQCRTGMRGYLAVRGGVEVPPVLGSRATDTLAGLGPRPLGAGSVLPVGEPHGGFPRVDAAPVATPTGGDLALAVRLGPRRDWFTPEALRRLLGEPFVVTQDSDRVGMRLSGPSLPRGETGELPSEGMVGGALQVPPDGRPTLFLADHPVTGGYPVIAVVPSAHLPTAAQARPGQRLWFRALEEPEP